MKIWVRFSGSGLRVGFMSCIQKKNMFQEFQLNLKILWEMWEHLGDRNLGGSPRFPYSTRFSEIVFQGDVFSLQHIASRSGSGVNCFNASAMKV